MANFSPPFSSNADKRYPTSDERQNGFECGPADQQLFNGMYHRIEAELLAVIQSAGITPSDDSLTQVRDAIQALIDAATGGGDPSIYLLLSQARARLPIFPDVLTTDGRITVVTAGADTARVPGGVTFLHRGIFPVTTDQTDFPFVANKTYHIRWNPTNGLVMRDLADPVYNPTTAPEASTIFDSGFDDMLIARVITNSANVPTITNLANKARLINEQVANGSGEIFTYGAYRDGVRFTNSFQLNWARYPFAIVTGTARQSGAPVLQGGANVIERSTVNRYGVTALVQSDWDRDLIAAQITTTCTLILQALAA